MIDESRRVFTSEKYDITIIELKKNDGLKDKPPKKFKYTAFKKIMEFLTKEIDI